jgi:hypothetical protein
MPTVYVSANFETSVELTADDDFILGEWTNKKLAKERKEYDKPNKGLWLQITNPEDEVDVYPIPVNEGDIYDGALEVTQSGKKFTFSFNGKAKVSIHKTTKEKLDLGLIPRVNGLMINGQSYGVDLPIQAVIQAKKI